MDIGIDLGTTFSVLAVPGQVELSPGYPEGEYLAECDVTIIPTPEGDKTFPSVLALEADNLVNPPKAIVIGVEEDSELLQKGDNKGSAHFIVGMEAKQAAERGESPIMWSKRKIGTTELLPLGNLTLIAKDVAREILKYLKSCAEQALGRPVTRAVITHPAYFDRSQVEETRQAASEAGFDMSHSEQLIMEPVAAALAYTRTDATDPLNIMVYDLGGGTFDVTVLERKQGVITPVAFDGNPLLGGINFDTKLAQWIIERASRGGERPIPFDMNNPEDRGRWAQLLDFAESFKERLARMKQKAFGVEVSLNFLVDGEGKRVQVREKISQKAFVELIKREMDETILCSQRCLSKANKRPEDLHFILLVGGSCHGPWVAEKVGEAFGLEPQVFNPDLAVAAGAALFTRSLPPPPPPPQGGLTLYLHNKDVSILPEVHIPGTLQGPDPQTLVQLMVILRTPQGQTLGPHYLSPDGGFLFDNVPLLEDRPTSFDLQVIDAQGLVHLDHTFTVTYEEEADLIPITPVLPKPLFVRTVGGMRLLADEGVPLPSKMLEEEFVRLGDGPELTLDIYQGDEPAGKLNISGIPPEAGEGAKVQVMVKVTEKNELKGEAVFKAPRTGVEVYRAPVKVTFPPLPIPDLADLRQQFRDLEDKRAEKIYLEADPVLRASLAGQGELLAQDIHQLLDGPNPDRQEVLQALRKLDRLVNPPPDDMQPPKTFFDSLLRECREALNERRGDSRVQALVPVLDRCEREGNEAFKQKDRRRWGAMIASLQDLQRRLHGEDREEKEKREIPPTPLLKDSAKMEIDQVRLEAGDAREIARADCPDRYEKKLKAQLNAIETTLNRMEDHVDKIPDDLPARQGLAAVQIAIRELKKLGNKINMIKSCAEVQ